MDELPESPPELEYVSRVDCEAQGCNPKHGDNGKFYFTGSERADTLNGHAVEVFVRVIRFSDWTSTQEA